MEKINKDLELENIILISKLNYMIKVLKNLLIELLLHGNDYKKV